MTSAWNFLPIRVNRQFTPYLLYTGNESKLLLVENGSTNLEYPLKMTLSAKHRNDRPIVDWFRPVCLVIPNERHRQTSPVRPHHKAPRSRKPFGG